MRIIGVMIGGSNPFVAGHAVSNEYIDYYKIDDFDDLSQYYDSLVVQVCLYEEISVVFFTRIFAM